MDKNMPPWLSYETKFFNAIREVSGSPAVVGHCIEATRLERCHVTHEADYRVRLAFNPPRDYATHHIAEPRVRISDEGYSFHGGKLRSCNVDVLMAYLVGVWS